jgi:hypothetical protein
MNQNAESHSRFPFGTASKTVKHRALWLGALWLVGGTTLMFCISPFLLKRRFAEFNQAHINAPIESINVADHGLAVQLRIKGNSYTFYPTTKTTESAVSNFVELAQIGDSVKKESKSDTLYLLKRPAFYKLLFKHF